MMNPGPVRTLRAGCVALALFVGGCNAAAPGRAADAALPPIVMTSHGGFEIMSQTWTIAADGSWTFTQAVKSVPPKTTNRSGQLSADQQRELAVLAADPVLQAELRASPGPCSISDGPTERLEVGSLRYLANWCDEHRPLIARMRARIEALTTGQTG